MTYRLMSRICREAGLIKEALNAYRGMRRWAAQACLSVFLDTTCIWTEHDGTGMRCLCLTRGHFVTAGLTGIYCKWLCMVCLRGDADVLLYLLRSCGFKPNNMEWREVIAAAVEAAMSGDGAITAQEVDSTLAGVLVW